MNKHSRLNRGSCVSSSNVKGSSMNAVIESPVVNVESSPVASPVVEVSTTPPVKPSPIECKYCKQPMQKYGVCGNCGRKTKTPATDKPSTSDKLPGVSYTNLEPLQAWKYKLSNPVTVYMFADEQCGHSILYSRFMSEIALPSEIAYHQQLVSDLTTVGPDGIEEYVERTKDNMLLGRLVVKQGAPVALQNIMTTLGMTKEQFAAYVASM